MRWPLMGNYVAHSPQNPSRRCVSDIMFLLLLPAAAGALMTPQPAKAALSSKTESLENGILRH